MSDARSRPRTDGLFKSALAAAALLIGMGLGQPVTAQSDQGTEHAGEHLHTLLETSAELHWPELIDITLANYPRFIELAARDREARALVERGRSWLSGRPAIALRYQTDQPWDNANLQETELGLELPLWRLGERRAAGSVGSAATDGASAATLALRLEVVGLLRMSLWDIEKAANELAVARDGARIAAELEAAVQRRYEAGELPLSETLLVSSVAMERQARVIEADAMRVDAERAYQSLTGLTERPADFAEALTERDDFDDSHPRLMLADAELERARAERDLVERTAKGAPTLTIGPQRERAAYSSYSARSVNLSFSIPIGGRSHAATATTAAERQAARAESDRAELLRQLDLELHEARHTLLVVEESLELARRRDELAATSFEMSRRAFEEGEITLLELLQSEETALRTEREVAGLEVERQRTIAQINQAIGVWP